MYNLIIKSIIIIELKNNRKLVIILKLEYFVCYDDVGKSLKFILRNKLEISENLIKRLKNNNKIFCNSNPVRVNYVVNENDFIEVYIDFVEKSENIIPQDIPLDIIFEDDSIIAINKSSSIIVHPTIRHPSGTIANAIMHYLNNKNVYKKIRPVSRLDKDTTGIIIFAKNEYIQDNLIKQMQTKTFKKEYMGIVHGIVKNINGTIDLPIARKNESIIERYISLNGQSSITHYEVLEHLNNSTLLKFNLETGRTHQIRVHCQAIGHPLIGDTLYGLSCNNISSDHEEPILRQALHSFKVSFIHPISKKQFSLSTILPQDMKNLLEILKK